MFNASFWVFVGFVLFWAFFGRLIFGVCKKALQDRIQGIKKALEEAKALYQKAKDAYDALKNREPLSQKHCHDIVAHAEKDMADLREETVKALDAYESKQKKFLDARLEQVKNKELKGIQDILVDHVMEDVEQKLQDAWHEKAQDKALNHFLKNLNTSIK